MPNYLSPGVYVEEVSARSRSIEGVPTSTAGFVGTTERGSLAPRLITSFSEFQRFYGGNCSSSAYLPHAVRGFFQNGGTRCYVARVPHSATLQADDFDSGLTALAAIDEISILVAPEDVLFGTQLSTKLIAQCETRRDRFAIISAAANQADLTNLYPPGPSAYAAFYYPWIQLADDTLIPASGHIAGICANTDALRGVHKAPANAVIIGAADLELPVTRNIQQVLNPRGVNCLRSFPARGILVWGARTMSPDPEWRYIPVRRTCIFIEESIQKGLQWAVFEPNNQNTWAAVRSTVEQFLHNLWRQGALRGEKPDTAYFVRCDQTTMTQSDINNGRLILHIGVALVRPAEFIIIRITLKTATKKPARPRFRYRRRR